MYPHDLQTPVANGFGCLSTSLPTGQTDKGNEPAAFRPFACEHHRVLPHCPEVRRQPVANVNESLLDHLFISTRITHLGPRSRNSNGINPRGGLWLDPFEIAETLNCVFARASIAHDLHADPFISGAQPVHQRGRGRPSELFANQMIVGIAASN